MAKKSRDWSRNQRILVASAVVSLLGSVILAAVSVLGIVLTQADEGPHLFVKSSEAWSETALVNFEFIVWNRGDTPATCLGASIIFVPASETSFGFQQQNISSANHLAPDHGAKISFARNFTIGYPGAEMGALILTFANHDKEQLSSHVHYFKWTGTPGSQKLSDLRIEEASEFAEKLDSSGGRLSGTPVC